MKRFRLQMITLNDKTAVNRRKYDGVRQEEVNAGAPVVRPHTEVICTTRHYYWNSNMIEKITRDAMEELFRAPEAERGSNAKKLETLRRHMKSRQRELRLVEREARENNRTQSLTLR
ncbi:hypothetical protein [Metarhizobium album]|uniref:hypothetical protein n=1 Tax=Metarhizobium album TaxID=2182425 RepID=UPI000FFF4110|nr:hypothetical protein [Rhizobium album]